MRHPILLTLTALLALSPVAAPASNSIVGTWQCISSSPDGGQLNWVLTVTERDGRLAGTLVGDPGEFPITEAKVEGDTFTFKVIVNSETYAVEGKVAGDNLAATYSGPQSQGTLKGTRQSS